jgi:uncharacterized protein DUF1565
MTFVISPRPFLTSFKLVLWVAVLSGVIFTWLSSTDVYASTLYVDAALGNDVGNCQGSPCKTITYAIIQAVSGDVINVSTGTYFEHLYFSKNLTLNGAGIVSTTIAQDPGAIPGIIAIYPGGIVTITGVTVQNGPGNGYDCFDCYGILNAGEMKLQSVLIEYKGSSNDSYGYGIQNYGTLRVFNSTVRDQYASGIYSSGELELNNIIVANNISYSGAGIRNEGTLRVMNSTISDNYSTNDPYNSYCGGIENEGSLALTNTRVIRNRSGAGGGICNGGTASLSGATVEDNIARYGSGIFSCCDNTTLSIESSTISTNTATVTGSGLSARGTIFITNSTISGNKAEYGNAGIENLGRMKIVNSTISSNTMTQTVGYATNIFSGVQADSYVQLANTIINGSSNANCVSDAGFGFISLGHNLSSDNTCNLHTIGDMSNMNPLLGPLQLNPPGTTLTQALLSGSPARNTGSNFYCPATDQRGVARPIGPLCDIGAFESDSLFVYYIFPLIFR